MMANSKVPYKQSKAEHNHNAPDELDLQKLLAEIWRGKWVICSTTLVFLVVGAFYALSRPNIYEASVLLAPAQDEGSSGRIGGQLGGLASLAGINIAGGRANQTTLAKEVLQSRAFLESFIYQHNLAVPLMATKGWDMKNQKWIIDREVYDPESDLWLSDGSGQSLEPTDWDLVTEFKGRLTISEDKDTGMLTVWLKSRSPVAAANWLRKLVKDINEHMRAEDVKEAERRIEYLEQKLSETNIAGMRQMFYQLIERETRTAMLANAQSEYVFKTLDPAVVPQKKSEPNRAIIMAAAILCGLILSVFTIFAVAFIRQVRQKM